MTRNILNTMFIAHQFFLAYTDFLNDHIDIELTSIRTTYEKILSDIHTTEDRDYIMEQFNSHTSDAESLKTFLAKIKAECEVFNSKYEVSMPLFSNNTFQDCLQLHLAILTEVVHKLQK